MFDKFKEIKNTLQPKDGVQIYEEVREDFSQKVQRLSEAEAKMEEVEAVLEQQKNTIQTEINRQAKAREKANKLKTNLESLLE